MSRGERIVRIFEVTCIHAMGLGLADRMHFCIAGRMGWTRLQSSTLPRTLHQLGCLDDNCYSVLGTCLGSWSVCICNRNHLVCHVVMYHCASVRVIQCEHTLGFTCVMCLHCLHVTWIASCIVRLRTSVCVCVCVSVVSLSSSPLFGEIKQNSKPNKLDFLYHFFMLLFHPLLMSVYANLQFDEASCGRLGSMGC